MKILIVTDNRYWREQIGSHRRISSLCNFFLKRGDVLEVLFVGHLYPPDTAQLMKQPLGYAMTAQGTHALAVETVSTPLFISPKLRYTKNLIRQLKIELERLMRPSSVGGDQVFRKFFLQVREPKLADFQREALLNRFRHICEQSAPDVVLIEFVRLAWVLKAAAGSLSNHCLKLIDTHDVQYERQSRFHRQGELHDIDITPMEEAAALKLGDVVLAIQGTDASKLRELVPDKRVIVVGFPSAIFQHAPRASGPVCIGFFGSSMLPNQHAVDRLMHQLFPPLREQYGDRVELHIFGGVCMNVDQLNVGLGVHCHGFVEDLTLAYDGLDIIANPVDFGGGLKIKNVEALCHGRPLVTTAIGAEGLELGAGSAFWVAADDEDFIHKLDLLVCNSDQRDILGGCALEFARQNFGEDAVFLELNKILAAVKKQPEFATKPPL